MEQGLQTAIHNISKWRGIPVSGRVSQVVGLLIESIGPAVHLGELCLITPSQGEAIPCEVVGFKDKRVLLMPLGEMLKISPGDEVYPTGSPLSVGVADSLKGRVIDALGAPIDGKGPLHVQRYLPITASPPSPLMRQRIQNPLFTGVKAIDATCLAGKGQRLGIFSGSGVGKSTLMGMIAKQSSADLSVIALIGERGREVREFIEEELGEEGLARSVVVVATSDQAALLRAKGANLATTIAEYFRDQGLDVLLMMDSITRYAMALREIGLATGEPPTTKGYTPSVFAKLPKLLERAGNGEIGSITGIYTILVEGDDLSDPVADTVRSILDGHLVLTRKLANANHFPALDVLQSLSRVMKDICPPEYIQKSGKLRDLLQTYQEAEDLINIGAYTPGSNTKIDEAISQKEAIWKFLEQKSNEGYTLEQTRALLDALVTSE